MRSHRDKEEDNDKIATIVEYHEGCRFAEGSLDHETMSKGGKIVKRKNTMVQRPRRLLERNK